MRSFCCTLPAMICLVVFSICIHTSRLALLQVLSLPKHPNVWRRYVTVRSWLRICLPVMHFLCLLQMRPSVSMLLRCTVRLLLRLIVYVLLLAPWVSLCNSMPLPFDAPLRLTMDFICSHTLMSTNYARRMKIHVEPSVQPPLQLAVADGTSSRLARYASICKVVMLICRVMCLILLMLSHPGWGVAQQVCCYLF